MQALADLCESVAAGEVAPDLLDDPDCLAELEFTYSVFRLRYTWGTAYEVTFTNLADATDRAACWSLVPTHRAAVLDVLDSDTMGIGYNGVVTEVTHRLVSLD